MARPQAGARPSVITLAQTQAGRPEIALIETTTRLWDLHPSLHCSIIGTCLTAAELRQILRKLGLSGIDKSSAVLQGIIFLSTKPNCLQTPQMMQLAYLVIGLHVCPSA